MSPTHPAYLSLLESGELAQRAQEAVSHLAACDLCPRECKADRLSGKHGVCQTGARAQVSSYGPHHGEEYPLRGWRGSGTIFFSQCNLRCQYCQNFEISQVGAGAEVEPKQLAQIMISLQSSGCHNINLVSPTHVVAPILQAVLLAAQQGLRIPLVYNTGGYDCLTTLRLLEGVIEIYMPDIKYANAQVGLRYSKIRNYPAHNQAAVKEMHRQVGDLQIDPDGIATRGLLVRHLVLPNGLAGTEPLMQFLATEVSPDTYVNIMDQYRPTYQAQLYPQLTRRPKPAEIEAAIQAARAAGLWRLEGVE